MRKLSIFGLFLSFILVVFTTSSALAQIKLGYGGSSKKDKFKIDYANPKEYTIEEITVEGVKYLNEGTIIAMSGLRKGDKIRIPGDAITNAVRKLWKPGLVGNVKIDATKVKDNKIWLKITLSERPRLSRYEFYGVPKGQHSTLSEKISLIRGRMLNDAILKNTENALRNHYIEKGFKNIEVKITPQPDTTISSGAKNWVYLRIDINKHKKVRIEEITFEGISEIKEKRIRRKLKKTKQKRFGRVFAPSKFVESLYEEDKENLIKFYNKLGYRNASIDVDTVWDVTGEDLVKIKFKITEGKKFRYRNLTWTGNSVYKDETLARILGIKKGDIYNPEELQKRLNFSPTSTDIMSLYMDDGYLFFQINPTEVQVSEDSIDIEMRIVEGEQADINKIIINGNTVTSDHVIYRELRTIPGEKFSRSDLIRTQQELAGLGYFDPETINIRPIPNQANGTVDIVYDLEEKSSNQFELSGGWGGFQGFIGTLGLSVNNFSTRKMFKQWNPIPQGDGQQLSLRMQSNGRAFQNYSFSFTEPWFGGKKPHSLSFSVSYSISRQRNSVYDVRSFSGKAHILSTTISFGRRLTFPDDRFTMLNSFSYLRYNLDNFQSSFGDFTDGISNSFVLNTTIARNSIDNPTYPRGGSSVSLSISLTPPYSLFSDRTYSVGDPDRFKWIEYHKWMFDNSWYTKLVGNLVLRTSAHMGFIGVYGDRDISPFERFTLGGSGLTINNFLLGTDIIGLRGYTDNSIRPIEFDENGNQRSEIGGVTYNKFVMELRYPISLKPAATIFMVAFAEAGNNWGNFDDFNPFEVRRSVGAGARIFMPAFGMLGFDWAYGFDEIPGVPNANGAQFHFTIGQQIR